MRKIAPYFDDAPNELWEEASKKRHKTRRNPNGTSKIDLTLSQKATHKFDREIYGSKIVKDKLKSIFKAKCAYCETNTYTGAHKDVEHYRDKKHYYWLGYEWTNLLLACQICNRTHKRNHFLLENNANRVITHPLSITGELDRIACHIEHLNSVEQPLLLHPAIDEPKEHIIFLSDGSVQALSDMGRVSIQVYGLDRQNLEEARKTIVYNIRKDILEEYKHTVPDTERIKVEIKKVINKLIARIENEESEYIGFATAILENFEAFIIDNQDKGIDMPDKEIMRQAARAILNP